MMRKPVLQLSFLLMLIGFNGAALAHPGHDASGFSAGLIHPLTGTDHLLAMLAVGLWAAQQGGRKVWLLPATFMLLLAAGAGLAQIATLPPPPIEPSIAASVMLLGMITALSLRLSIWLSIAITALFGGLHGYAHGMEIPGAVEPVAYALGFLVATAALHLTGMGIGIATRQQFPRLSQILGIAIAASGLWMLSTI